MATTTERFTRSDCQRMLDVSDRQLSYWEKLGLVSSKRDGPQKSYDFRDLISLRTTKELVEKGIPANRLRRSLVALQEKLSEVQTSLNELRILCDGKDVIVEREGSRLEPLSGQFVMNFDTRSLSNKVRSMPQRSAKDWFTLALQYDSDGHSPSEILDAYEHAVALDPYHTDALINLGTVHYEQANLEKAAECFQRAVELDAASSVAHFNLGSVLEEMGQMEAARQHLRLAVRLDPRCANAHYNLAFVCEKLGAFVEAREHWRAYIALDPLNSSCQYARQRLAEL